MKTIYIILAALLVFLLFFNGCIVTVIGDVTAPAPTASNTLKLISLVLFAAYEVVVRVVPSVADYSFVSWIIGILKKISDTLNIRT